MNLKTIIDRQENLKKIIPQQCTGPVFIHSDLFRAGLFIKQSVDRETSLITHLDFLKSLFAGRELWFPAFNYQFPKTKIFDVKTTTCEVGPLPEYFRKHNAQWRTPDPIFSVCGVGGNPSSIIPKAEIIALGSDSVFATLTERNGSILFYGGGFTATFLHYVETLLSPLPYRYIKLFTGMIIINHCQYPVNYFCHVRPKGFSLDYAWDKLLADLQKNGIAHSVQNNLAHIMSAANVKEYWTSKYKEDPFYFLDEPSKKWVIPKLEELGRNFELKDFE